MVGGKSFDNQTAGTARLITPETALSPSEFYSLYLGGLSLPNRRKRLRATTIIMLSGRLGLRPGEIQHLHEGWIDWDAGVIRIPIRDPCACKACWETARNLQRAGDGRRLVDIVTETMWTPPGGARTVPFGWSERLTALIATLCNVEGYLDVSVESMTRLLTQVGRRAEGIDQNAVDFCALRSSAATFFADAGFSTDRVAEIVGEDPDRIRQFVKQEGGDVREQLFRQFDDSSGRELTETYPLLADPEPFDPEPVDPPSFDAEWRQNRSKQQAQAPDPLQNPRPVSDAVDISFDTDEMGTRTHLDEESDLIENSHSLLSRWVETKERRRQAARSEQQTPTNSQPTQQQSAEPAQQQSAEPTQQQSADSRRPAADTGGESVDQQDDTAIESEPAPDPLELLGDEPKITTTTTVACSEMANGQPVRCRLLIGPETLVIVRDDDSMTNEYKQISLSDIVDQSSSYIPSKFRDSIDSAVTIAYNEGGGREVAVLELSGNQKQNVSSTLFKLMLTGSSVVVTHPAERGGHVTDVEPKAGEMQVFSRSLSITLSDDREFSVRIGNVMDVDMCKQDHDGRRIESLSIQHIRNDAAVTSQIGIPDDRKNKLLSRFVKQRYRERKRQIKQLSLSEEQKEVLVALFSAGSQMDISMIIDQDSETLQKTLGTLRKMNLAEMTGTGTDLTTLGRVVVSQKIDDVNM